MYKDGVLETGAAGVGMHVQTGDLGGAERPVGANRVEVGPDNLEWVQLDEIQLLKQVRQDYDQRDIEALAFSIIKDRDAFDAAETPEEISATLSLMHPLTINRMTHARATTYLQKHADFYELELPEIVPRRDAQTVVNISGHRRYLALEYLFVKMKSLTMADAQVLAQVYYDLPFEKALALQLRENVKTNPPAQDEAKSIERYYQYLIETSGKVPSRREVASHLGFTTTKVEDALAFMSLPEKIRDYVSNPKAKKGKGSLEKNKKIEAAHISYTTLVRFVPFMVAVTQKYDQARGNDADYSVEARDENVELRLKILAKNVSDYLLKGHGADYVEKYLTGQIKTARDELLFEQGELMQVEEDTPERRNNRASDLLTEGCLVRLQLLAEHGELNPRYTDALRSVLEIMDQQAMRPDHQN